MSSESSDSWGGGRGGLKILTFAVCHAVAEEVEACEAGRKGILDGGRGWWGVEGLGDWWEADLPLQIAP